MSIEADFRAFKERAFRLRKEALEAADAFRKELYVPDYPKTAEEKRVCELAKAAIDYAASIAHAYNHLKKAMRKSK